MICMAEPRDPDPSFEEWASEIEDLGQAVTYLVQKRADWWTLQQVFAEQPDTSAFRSVRLHREQLLGIGKRWRTATGRYR